MKTAAELKTYIQLSGKEIKDLVKSISMGVRCSLPSDAEFILTVFNFDDDTLYTDSSVKPKEHAEALIQFGQFFIDKGKEILRRNN